MDGLVAAATGIRQAQLGTMANYAGASTRDIPWRHSTTYVGTGTGSFNGVPDATAIWTFTDAGEPGHDDSATIKIIDVNGNTVLTVSGTLDSGNQQAHNDNK
jgi:hypothetical protein